MIVCNCKNVSEAVLITLINANIPFYEIVQMTQVGTGCGMCHSVILKMFQYDAGSNYGKVSIPMKA